MIQKQRTNRLSLLVAASLCGLCVLSTGCNKITGAMMETAIKNGSSDNPKQASFAKRLQKVQDECPKRINDYTVLKSVSLGGINRVEFVYEVSKSGIKNVNLGRAIDVRKQCLQQTLDNPIAPSVIACDLKVCHIFRDTDGKPLIESTIDKADLKRAGKNRTTAAGTKKVNNKKAVQPVVKSNTKSAEDTQDADKSKHSDTITGETTKDTEKPDAETGKTETLEPAPVATPKKDVWLPNPVKETRSRANPAGVQGNPFAQ